tara:strand:- start:270 stop:389 length:120 start_codon:yes stop_codon:yes gene_type:complete
MELEVFHFGMLGSALAAGAKGGVQALNPSATIHNKNLFI